MKKVMLISTDGEDESRETDNPRYIAFAKDMTKAKIPWRWYSGRFMYGVSCPASVTNSPELNEEDIIRATKVKGLKQDELGRDTVIYPGL